LLDLNGDSFDLWAQNPAAATVVLFTRSDCPVSNRYAPEIRRLYEAYHPRGLEFYLVYVDPREQPDAIRHHMQEYGYTCHAVRDPKHALVAYCHATATPEAVVFDRNQKIAYMGRISDLYPELRIPRPEPTTHELADAIDATLEGRHVEIPRTKAVGCAISDLKD
jgi:hypothetical protein